MTDTSAAVQPSTTAAGAAVRPAATVRIVAVGIFAMVTSEFMAAGLLPQIAEDNRVTLGAAALLISGFAAGQVVGAWLVGLPLSRYSPGRVLAGLLTAFAIVQLIGVASGSWPVLLGARVLTGTLMSAYFATALSLATRLVQGPQQPRAVATVFAGVTIGTTLGLPLATFAGQSLAWQWAFHIDTAVVALSAVAVLTVVPRLDGVPPAPLRTMLAPLRNGRLWGTFATAGLAIGGTLMAFGFFSAILQDVTGVSPAVVPWLLAAYGAASVLGNWAVGRLAERGPATVLTIGLAMLAVGLLAFWAAPDSLPVAIGAMLLIGLTGVSLNAAHTARTLAVGGRHPAIMSMMPMVVTAGILVGTATGALAVDSPLGLTSPLWLGAVLATAALVSLAPDAVLALRERRSTAHGEPAVEQAADPCPEASTA